MKHKRILSKKHTAKLVHRHHTAYGYLLLILLLACVPLFVASASVGALPGDPVSGSNDIFAVVPAPVPSSAPIIKSIADGQTFSTADLVTISGTCPDNTIVKLFKNQVMAGSDLCNKGLFTIKIDLFIGANSIVAQAFNVNNIAGPGSDPVNVRFVLGASTSNSANQFNDPANQLFVTSEKYFAGAHINETLKWPITISGGQAPYAVSVGWGDGKSDLISRGQAGTFEVQHIYDSPGQDDHNSYDITIQVSDQQGNKSFLHVVSVVGGGQPSAIGSAKAGYNLSTAVRVAWQLLILGVVVFLGFWVGEKYEIHVLKRKYNIAP